jgi:TonB family protein
VTPERKILGISFVVSIVLHVTGGWYARSPVLHKMMEPKIEFHEVGLTEEEQENKPKKDERKIPPKVKKMMQEQKEQQKPQLDLSKMMTTEKIDIGKGKPAGLPTRVDNDISMVATTQPLLKEQIGAPSISLEDAQQIMETSASIDISNLEPTLAGAGVDEIISVNPGGGKSTSEILNEAPVIPAISVSGDGSGEGSLLGSTSSGVIMGGPAKGVITLDNDVGVSLNEPAMDIGSERKTLDVSTVASSTPDKPQVEIGGEISTRKILSKKLPQYPAWALRQGISGTVVLQFWVTPGGQVRTEKVIVLQTTGHSDLDQVAISALRAWKFAPLAANVKQQDQSGTLVIRFVLM